MQHCLSNIDGSKSSPAIWRSPTAALTGRCCLFLVLSLLAACSGSEGAGQVNNLFVANTTEGVALVRVDGMATGFTNSELTRLIRRGMAGIFPILCRDASDNASTAPKMVWHIINDGRKPTAVVTVKVIETDGIVRAKFANISAPGINPDAVFMHDVADLAYRIISPASSSVDQTRSDAAGCRA